MQSDGIYPGVVRVGQHTNSLQPSEYIMAVAVNPDIHMPLSGVARIVTKRQGDVAIAGYVDHSELHKVTRTYPGQWNVGKQLSISGLEEKIRAIYPDNTDFVGLEDPDIVVDTDGVIHLFFTIPFIGPTNKIYLGHAKGSSLDTLKMQEPVMRPLNTTTSHGEPFVRGFKELCPSPPDSTGTSHHLVESNDLLESISYSTIAITNAKSLDGPWEFAGDVVHPAELTTIYAKYVKNNNAYEWCGEHVSPCRLIPKDFIVSGRYRIGILNGRERSKDGVYGKFRPGLFLYDPETGTVPWVDPSPLFDDLNARTIIFASDLVVNEKAIGRPSTITLMTHIDDSYLQEYQISASIIKNRLPAFFTNK